MKPLQCIIFVALPVFLFGFEQALMSTYAATIAIQIGAANTMAWILSAYFIASAISTPVYGQLSDAIGPIRILIIALVIFGFGGALASLAETPSALVCARIVQGLGGGALLSMPQAFLSRNLAPRTRAAYQGYMVTVALFANSCGPVIGGVMISSVGWQAIFLTQLPIVLGALALLRVARRHEEPSVLPAMNQFDWPGLALMAVSITSLVLLTQELARPGIPLRPLLWAAVAVLSGVAFLKVERRSRNPLVPMDLIGLQIVWRSCLIVGLYGAGFTALTSFLPVLLLDGYGVPVERIGVLMILPFASVGIGSILVGRLVRRSGKTMIYTARSLSVVSALFLIFACLVDRLSGTQAAVWMGLSGLFMGATLGVVQVALQIGTPRTQIGSAIALVQLSRTVGSCLGASIGALIYFRSSVIGLPGAGLVDPADFRFLFLFLSALILGSAVTAFRCHAPHIEIEASA